MDLKKKVILVTGSSSGIGKQTALGLAARGAYVIVTYNRNKQGGEEVYNECLRLSGKCLLLKLDNTDKKSITDAVGKIKRKFGKLDVLVNNAGMVFRKPFHLQTLEEIEMQIETNLLGGIRVTRMMLPIMASRGIIINLGSLKSKNPAKRMIPYCASKYGVRGFTQSLALELPKNIKICILNPSPTATRMHYFEGDNPKDVADVIIRVAEEKIRFKNGQDVDVKDYIKRGKR